MKSNLADKSRQIANNVARAPFGSLSLPAGLLSCEIEPYLAAMAIWSRIYASNLETVFQDYRDESGAPDTTAERVTLFSRLFHESPAGLSFRKALQARRLS